MSLFSSPKSLPLPPPPKPLPPIPTAVAPGIGAINTQREKVRRASGSRPILTAPGGLIKPATTTGLKTLLGE